MYYYLDWVYRKISSRYSRRKIRLYKISEGDRYENHAVGEATAVKDSILLDLDAAKSQCCQMEIPDIP